MHDTTLDPHWHRPFCEFRYADNEEAVALAILATGMRKVLNLDGWLDAYFHDGREQAYFHDTTTGRWVIPLGNWQSVDPHLLSADAANWIAQ